ncbi:MAG: outer membrane beta-barrel protein [Desulfobacca sp.]|nr:outer membrane beta-barrel protein [Desulfobacca sp.]
MRSKGKIIITAAIAALVLVPALCWAEMFVEGYVGGNIGDNTHIDLRAAGVTARAENARIDPSAMGGIKVGYWFTKEGFLGYDYPDWMKYLGFVLDLSYHNLDFRRQEVRIVGPTVPPGTRAFIWEEGRAFTIGFMFNGRYGFLPDSEVPFGRLQPYVAVGPALLIASAKIPNGDHNTATEIAVMVDAGVRYMALKNVSLDLAFRYRYSEPSFDYNVGGVNVRMEPEFNLFSFYLGAAYHF